jgi:cytochrome subunit of sulfide dehydrogenase
MNEPVRMLVAMLIAAPALAFGGSPPGASSCLGCHPVAADGGPVLSLSTFSAEQVVTAMQAFRSGARPATVMDRVAKGFSDEEVRAIAQWYARAESK